MIAGMTGVVVHPWMTRRAEETAWLAWAIRTKADELRGATERVSAALGSPGLGAAQGDEPTAGSAAPHTAATADDGTHLGSSELSTQLTGLYAALSRTADALDEFSRAIAEHGPQIEMLRGELERLGPRAVWRIATVRARIRIHTDALTEADVACRRAIEQATREVPSASGIAATEPGAWAAVLGLPTSEQSADVSLAGCSDAHTAPTVTSADSRDALSGMLTVSMERALAASPELRVRLAADVPDLGASPEVSLSRLAELAGVDPDTCVGATRAVQRRARRSLYAGGTTPQAARIATVRETFAQLGDDATRRIALLWPRLVGGLDGAPLEARALANRTVVRAELESARRSEAELGARAIARRVADEPFVLRRLRSTAAMAYTRREWLMSLVSVRVDEPLLFRDDVRTRLRLHLRLLTERHGPDLRPRSLIDFDPSGRGRIVELMGEWCEQTEHLAVIVPGTGTGMAGYHLPAGTASDIVAADPSARTAALCWMGADFPSAIVNEAILARYARSAGPALTGALLALDVPPHVIVTVIGHSYGSPMVGAAEAAGLPADRVVHLASPGAGPGIRSLDDYARVDPLGRIRRVERYACTAPGDPIRLVHATPFGWPVALRRFVAPALSARRMLDRAGVDLALFDAIGLGVDPARLPGIRTFEAGVWETDTKGHRAGDAVAGRPGHAGVVTAGSTAFRRLVDIVTAPPARPATR